ncbi:MAG: hypothetical protein JXP34_22990 [Planctomycetes bacterium]|nr:hypothetical protein [Planctomycetota bacterium]
MAAFVLGLLALATFSVPLLCPLLAVACACLSIECFVRRRGRVWAIAGVLLSAVALFLLKGLWEFRHLP